jgi:hypothetical protein
MSDSADKDQLMPEPTTVIDNLNLLTSRDRLLDVTGVLGAGWPAVTHPGDHPGVAGS